MVIAQKLSPEAFIEFPRRGDLVPNEKGTLGLYNVSTHTLGGSTLKEWRARGLGLGASWRLTANDKVHDVNWVPGDDNDVVVWLESADKGLTKVVIADAGGVEDSQWSYVAAEVDAPIQGLKLRPLEDGSLAFAVIGLVDKDGKLYNEEKEQKLSSARIYDGLAVREWDSYVKPQKYVIWYTKLVQSEGKWEFAAPLQNAVKDTILEAPSDMYEPGDAASNYDISVKGITFTARNPEPESLPAYYDTSSDVYFVPIDSWDGPVGYKPTKIAEQSNRVLGMAANPRFSPDGSMIAYLKQPFDCPADTRLLMGHIGSLASFDAWDMVIAKPWDLVPASFEYAPHGESIFVITSQAGREALYEVELRHHADPKPLTQHGSVSSFYPLTSDNGDLQLLVSSSSFIDSSVYTLLDTKLEKEPKILSSSTKHGQKLGLSHSQVSEIYFEGSENQCVHAWVVKPRDFDDSKKYPVVVMVHGGPRGAWHDAWSTRWNPVVWAEQGYIIVLPNPTGSTGFGIPFETGIYGEWGGRPYTDLANCMEYLQELPYIDMERAAVAGGSYGGYMVNWILGQPLAKKFKVAISHDSVFDMRNVVLFSDEVGGVTDWNGPGYPWSNIENLDKWNPARPDLLANWKDAPPTLVIHSDKDYRCAVTDGFAVHRVLQCLKVPSRYLTFPDENHWVLKQENSLVWHKTVFDWLEKWIGKGPSVDDQEEWWDA